MTDLYEFNLIDIMETRAQCEKSYNISRDRIYIGSQDNFKKQYRRGGFYGYIFDEREVKNSQDHSS